MSLTQTTQEYHSSEWITGKLAGCISRDKEYCIQLRFNLNDFKRSESFAISKYGSKEDAIKAAEERRLELNKKHKLSKNDYRIVDDSTLEVKLTQGYTMLVDREDLDKVQQHIWQAHIRSTSGVYATCGDPKVATQAFHRLILSSPGGLEVDHINGTVLQPYLLDNRKSNLRVVTRNVQANNRALQKSNKTGVNGVSHIPSSKCYTARCQHNQQKEQKDFYYGVKSLWTQQEAFEAAVEWRKQKDEANGCTNGSRPCLNLKPTKSNNKRKREETAVEEQEAKEPAEQLSKRVTKTVITEYFK